MSDPGEPSARIGLPSLKTIAGLPVTTGRRPGSTRFGMLGSTHDWTPRLDMASPVPGVIGVWMNESLKVTPKTFPQRSATLRWLVSTSAERRGAAPLPAALLAAPLAALLAAPTSSRVAAPVHGSPAGGISGQARFGSIRLRRAR